MAEQPDWINEIKKSVESGLEERIKRSEILNLVGQKLDELKQNPSPETLKRWAQILSQQEPNSFESRGENVNDARYLFFFFALQILNTSDDSSSSADRDILDTLNDNQHDDTFFQHIIDEIENIESSFLEILQVNETDISSYKETLGE